MRYRRRAASCAALLITTGVVGLQVVRTPVAVAADEDEVIARQRCATRLSVSFLGLAPTTELLVNPRPQDAAATMVQTPEFIERYASFLNAEFNPFPGETAAGDLPYYLAKHVLSEGLPYHELFDGKFDLVVNATSGAIVVNPSDAGLGYFRSRGWLVRYAGNEPSGLRLTAAYRIMQNIVGLKLVAQNNADGKSLDADGRKASACAGCHYQGWSALDPIASILTRRRGTGIDMDFAKPIATSVDIAGQKVQNDAEFVALLVRSNEFAFRACRLGFKYLRGRTESACDAAMFDACVDALRSERGTIQAGLVAMAQRPEFCQ